MSDTLIPSYRSGRGGNSDDRNSTLGNEGVQIVKGINVPRSYTSNVGGISITQGMYVYPKAGKQVFFYEDPDGLRLIGKSSGQVNDPMRTGSELVGTATGQVKTGTNGTFIQVDWVNSYTDHNFFKADQKVNQPRTGWVNSANVEWQKVYQSPEDKANPTTTDPILTGTGNASSGIDSTTLGYGAVAAALIFATTKKKRK